jgi:hypothetical protein
LKDKASIIATAGPRMFDRRQAEIVAIGRIRNEPIDVAERLAENREDASVASVGRACPVLT